jgi:uncharacterized protein YecE (DUF72 family)
LKRFSLCCPPTTAPCSSSATLCLSEREDATPPPLVETAPWGYLRLRLEQYSDDDLAAWAQRIAGTSWTEAHVYFMHEPTAPVYAATLAATFARLASS